MNGEEKEEGKHKNSTKQTFKVCQGYIGQSVNRKIAG